MVRQRTATTPILGAPSHKPLWQELYDHTAAPVVDWALDNKLASTVTAVAIAGAITAGVFLSTGGIARNVNRTQSTPAAGQISSSQSGQTASEIYYSQVRSAIMQDVPDLANYRSALDYTTQRMVDMKNVYNLNLDQVRAPIAKWVQANIDWDKKGERLVPLSEETDLIPDAMLRGNFTINPDANAISQVMKERGIDNPNLAALASYTDELIAEHDGIWADIKDPTKLKQYMDAADDAGSFPWVAQIATTYKRAIREHGTLQDQGQWALLGRLSYTKLPPDSNEEKRRNEYFLSSILAAGGDGRISSNVLYFENDTHPKGVTRGDRQTMFKMSPQLKNAIASRPEEFGTSLDPDFLAPELPSVEAVEAAKTYKWPAGTRNVSMPFVFVYEHWKGTSGSEKRFIHGSPEIARKFGWY